jgi:hypothetical protein
MSQNMQSSNKKNECASLMRKESQGGKGRKKGGNISTQLLLHRIVTAYYTYMVLFLLRYQSNILVKEYLE